MSLRIQRLTGILALLVMNWWTRETDAYASMLPVSFGATLMASALFVLLTSYILY